MLDKWELDSGIKRCSSISTKQLKEIDVPRKDSRGPKVYAEMIKE
jgi:hypothetical protein